MSLATTQILTTSLPTWYQGSYPCTPQRVTPIVPSNYPPQDSPSNYPPHTYSEITLTTELSQFYGFDLFL